jgi:hypothetical protein
MASLTMLQVPLRSKSSAHIRHQLLTFRVARPSRKRESNVRVVGRVVPARNE